MDDLVKNSIESRKNAIFNAYQVNDDALKNKIKDLFERIMFFGESCSDVGDFESKFAISDLNKEYINLFSKIATSCHPIPQQDISYASTKGRGAQVLDDIKDEMEYQAKEMSMPMKRRARQEAYDQARDIPIVGDVMNIKQHIDFFSRFKNLIKKRKDTKNGK